MVWSLQDGKAENPYGKSQLKETLNGKNENRFVFKLSVAAPGR